MTFWIVLIALLQAFQLISIILFIIFQNKEMKTMRKEIDRINTLMKYNP